MKLSLVVMTPGKQEGKQLEVKLTQFVIGRDPQCHLRPASPMISKRHCAVIQRDGKAFLRDFGSTNGTFVNDQPVTGEVELKNEDRLKVGPLLFIVKMEASAPVNRPTPPPATRAPAKTAAAAGAKPAGSDKTPPPPTKKQDDDDDIAAMLLSLGDDETPPNTPVDADGVPQGSTQMEILVPPGDYRRADRGEGRQGRQGQGQHRHRGQVDPRTDDETAANLNVGAGRATHRTNVSHASTGLDRPRGTRPRSDFRRPAPLGGPPTPLLVRHPPARPPLALGPRPLPHLG